MPETRQHYTAEERAAYHAKKKEAERLKLTTEQAGHLSAAKKLLSTVAEALDISATRCETCGKWSYVHPGAKNASSKIDQTISVLDRMITDGRHTDE